MAGRILTVRERVLTALVDVLAGITETNGFNTTVRHVRRLRIPAPQATDPPEIHIVAGESATSARGTTVWQVLMPVSLFFYIQDEPERLDREYSFMLGDIQRALGSGFVDPSAPPTPPREACIVLPMQDQPWETPFGVVGELNLTVRFWWMLTDPRRWDDQDNLVTE